MTARISLPMTGRVFPRTHEGLERAMQWVSRFDRTLTLMGVSTFTVLRGE